jgi:hypothetical protein
MAHPTIYLLGIRHHGPGSAIAVHNVLSNVKPDCILIEGPADAVDAAHLALSEELLPPVALLVHAVDNPRRAVFFPFAEFSPEWVALKYALRERVALEWMDLSVSQRFSWEDSQVDSDIPREESLYSEDSLDTLAIAAGYSDGEAFWDEVMESNRNAPAESLSTTLAMFEAITSAIFTLRTTHGNSLEIADVSSLRYQKEALREAQMRLTLRSAAAAGYNNIVVICGAWHTPALLAIKNNSEDKLATKADLQLLKQALSSATRVKTSAAWAPWSFDRLAMRSGYGAGITSPQWYQSLWEIQGSKTAASPSIHFATAAARAMRDADLEASSASVIETVRLAEQLSALRNRTQPSLDELLQSVQCVLAHGQTAPMELIQKQLIIGSRLGSLPANAPTTPLYADLLKQAKSLRLPQSTDFKDYDLDLRKDNDLARSQLLHRLRILGISWGEPKAAQTRSQGTFHEWWRLTWQPEFAVECVLAARLGATVEDAAQAQAITISNDAKVVSKLVALLDQLILADLPSAISYCVAQLSALAAASKDTLQMMQAFGRLTKIRRYGSVRQTDANLLDELLTMIAARVCIGVPGACYSLDDDAARAMNDAIRLCDGAFQLFDQSQLQSDWRNALTHLADNNSALHGLVAGLATRLVYNYAVADETTNNGATQTRISLALSQANSAPQTAAWVEGFNSGNASALLHDDTLWNLINAWLGDLPPEHFVTVLPLLRRSFSAFEMGERNALGDKALRQQHPQRTANQSSVSGVWNEANASLVLPILRTIFEDFET